MQEQAGIYRIVLYEAKDISFSYTNNNTIRSISNTGSIIEIENYNDSTIDLNFTFTHRRSGNNKLQYKNTLIWKQIGLNDSNLDLISQLKTSIYGWVPVIEFYNKSKKIIDNPLKFKSSEIDNNLSNHYNITIENPIFGNRIKDYISFTEGEGFISTDIPGGNVPDSIIPNGSETIHLN